MPKIAKYDEPLTVAESRLIAEYAEQYPDTVKTLCGVWPSTYYGAIMAGLNREDIESAGWEGVERAARKFDRSRGVLFATYANSWIRGTVTRAIYRSEFNKAGRAGGRLMRGDRRGGRGFDQPTALWQRLGLSDPRDWAGLPGENERCAELRERVADAMTALCPRRWKILALRFGLDGGGCRTLDQIGAVMGGLSRERINQLIRSAIERIQIPLFLSCRELVEAR